jgi:hypothetical protein
MRDSTYLVLKSCDQIGWQVLFQSPVFWWFRKMNCKAVVMCLQVGAVLSAETLDFLFNRRDLKVLSEDHVRHIPWCISYHA